MSRAVGRFIRVSAINGLWWFKDQIVAVDYFVIVGIGFQKGGELRSFVALDQVEFGFGVVDQAAGEGGVLLGGDEDGVAGGEVAGGGEDAGGEEGFVVGEGLGGA